MLFRSNYVDEIKQNVKTLFLTCPGEKIRDPFFGLGIRNYLFQNQNFSNLGEQLKTNAYSQIRTYMPFITINSLDVYESQEEKNLIYIRFSYFVEPLNLNDQILLSFAQ